MDQVTLKETEGVAQGEAAAERDAQMEGRDSDLNEEAWAILLRGFEERSGDIQHPNPSLAYFTSTT